MNVIVSNKQKNIIDNANIDAIKDLTGLFNVDDLIAKFKNYFFSKMILDVTSVENFTSVDVLQKLVDGIGSDRLILLLPETPPPPDEFKKMLIGLKIYNFSNNINEVVKLIDNPNTYETVLKGMDDAFSNDFGYVDNSIKENAVEDTKEETKEFDNELSFNSSTSLHDALDSFNIRDDSAVVNNENNSELGLNMDNPFASGNEGNDNPIPNMNSLYNIPSNENPFNLTDDNGDNNSESASNTGLYSTLNYDKANMGEDKNYYSDTSGNNENKSNYVFLNINGLNNINNDNVVSSKKVIGFKNVTSHAGSTSLIYMVVRALSDNLKEDVYAVEINRNDFKLFMNNRMTSILEKDAKDYLASRHEKIILVDLNDSTDTSFCDDVVYLIEPSTIMLNRLIVENQQIFKELIGKKVILNKSLLSSGDVSILSNEAGVDFVYNLAPLNDRVNNNEIVKLIDVLGLK